MRRVHREDSCHSAMLVGFKYRDKVHMLTPSVEVGFDTGSDLTYLNEETYDLIKESATAE
ncbi:hypothetical protein M758_9G108100 [Ceratodon purpureus]|nr:hypothetical protein M758_9G108100 [Ceratodon purpureus]